MEQKAPAAQAKKSRRTKELGAVAVHSDLGPVRKSKRKTKSMKAMSAAVLESNVKSPRPESPGKETDNDSHKDDIDTILNAASDDGGYHDFITTFSRLLAEDFWETAWDICETRFLYENSSQIIISDLRDTWLSIVESEWLDTEPTLLEQVKFPPYEDSIPLPPKFDFWSHGALELLPRSHRESVMDPFLREPMQWFLEKLEEDHQNLESIQSSSGAQFQTVEFLPVPELLTRPTSPVPTASEEGEDVDTTASIWSLASTVGSVSNLKPSDENGSDKGPLFSTPKSATSLAYANQSKWTGTRSVEFLYPSKTPIADIKASSEIAYRHGTKENKKRSENAGREIVAFKLPRQTSSESIRAHYDRKLREKESLTKSSSFTTHK